MTGFDVELQGGTKVRIDAENREEAERAAALNYGVPVAEKKSASKPTTAKKSTAKKSKKSAPKSKTPSTAKTRVSNTR